MNHLTGLCRRMFGSVGPWITDEQRFWRPRRNVLDTNAHGAPFDALTPWASAMVEQTPHDERSAAVYAAIEIMRNSQAHTRPLGGSQPPAPFAKLTGEEATLAVPPWVTGRRIRLGQNEFDAEKLTLLIVLILVGMYGIMALQYVNTQAVADRNERALALVTANDVVPLRLEPAPGVAAGTRGTYWGQVGANTAVLDVSDLPRTPQGARYGWWVEHANHWTSIGSIKPDATGSARMIAESPELATPPDALQVIREPDDSSQTPMASAVLIWPAR